MPNDLWEYYQVLKRNAADLDDEAREELEEARINLYERNQRDIQEAL